MDLISRQAAIEALWKALHDYEDKTEKQFQESDELDVWDWINHREFVQCMNDIDRATILNLPSAQPCYKTDHGYMWLCPECGLEVHSDYDRCVRCGWERRADE